MWKWLHPCFAWRFSLTRLVVAVVFLGAFVGLNMRKIRPCFAYWSSQAPVAYLQGWPLPFTYECMNAEKAFFIAAADNNIDPESAEERRAFERAVVDGDVRDYVSLPWYYAAYRLLEWPQTDWLGTHDGRDFCGIIDALVGLVPLILILFFHPRCKPPDEAP